MGGGASTSGGAGAGAGARARADAVVPSEPPSEAQGVARQRERTSSGSSSTSAGRRSSWSDRRISLSAPWRRRSSRRRSSGASGNVGSVGVGMQGIEDEKVSHCPAETATSTRDSTRGRRHSSSRRSSEGSSTLQPQTHSRRSSCEGSERPLEGRRKRSSVTDSLQGLNLDATPGYVSFSSSSDSSASPLPQAHRQRRRLSTETGEHLRTEGYVSFSSDDGQDEAADCARVCVNDKAPAGTATSGYVSFSSSSSSDSSCNGGGVEPLNTTVIDRLGRRVNKRDSTVKAARRATPGYESFGSTDGDSDDEMQPLPKVMKVCNDKEGADVTTEATENESDDQSEEADDSQEVYDWTVMDSQGPHAAAADEEEEPDAESDGVAKEANPTVSKLGLTPRAAPAPHPVLYAHPPSGSWGGGLRVDPRAITPPSAMRPGVRNPGPPVQFISSPVPGMGPSNSLPERSHRPLSPIPNAVKGPISVSPVIRSPPQRGLIAPPPYSPIPKPSLGQATAGGPLTPTTPTVKETQNVSRKTAELPQQEQMHHPQPVGGNWLKNRYIVNNYILLETLGTGSYAEVRLSKEKASNQLFAVKIINKDVMSKKQMGKEGTFLDDVKREIAIMKKVAHPNVLRLYEVMDDPKVNKLYLVLEFMKKGDLMKILNGDARRVVCDPMNDYDVWHCMRQVVQGLSYLHLQNIVHGDIKPQNLLVDEHNVVKIGDFGLGKILMGSSQRLHESVGTPAFMSPELVSGNAYNAQLADVWALGATIYMLRCGRPPFVSLQLVELYHKIQNEPLIFPPEINMSQGLRRLLSGMLVKDPPARLTLDQVVADVWLQRGDASFPAGAASRPAPPSPLRLAREFQRITISKDEINRAFNTTKTDTGGSGSAATSPKSAAPLHSQLSDVEMRKRGDKFAMSHSRARMSVTIHGGSEASECSDGDESDDWDGENSAVHVTPSKTRSRSHRLDSVEFNSVMDTLGAQPLRSPDTGKVEDTEVLEEITLKGRKFTADPECSNLRLRLRASHHSVQGSRPSQEDRVMVAIDASALEGIQRPYLFEQYALLGIYDGHSGDACASRLQSSLHLTLMSQPSFHAAIPSAMTAACTTVDADICSWCREGGDSSGSTALLICYDARRAKLHVANVGDSRCVLCRAGRAEALTHEHRLFREDEKRRVLRAGGLTHNNRLNGVLAVTRSFGDAHHKEGGEALIATPEITTVAVTADIEFIIMATDGLWDVMDSQPAVNFVRKRLNEHGDLTRCARELTARAMECGSIDNVSAVLFSWNQ